MRNGVDDSERTFAARLGKIDQDHVEALARIHRKHRICMWVIGICCALTVASAAFQVIKALQ